jgi:hypothetical protein
VKNIKTGVTTQVFEIHEDYRMKRMSHGDTEGRILDLFGNLFVCAPWVRVASPAKYAVF